MVSVDRLVPLEQNDYDQLSSNWNGVRMRIISYRENLSPFQWNRVRALTMWYVCPENSVE